MEYSRIPINSDIEKRILTGMIVDTQYLRDVSMFLKPNLFKVDYIRKIVSWILEYYKAYKQAPNRDFESIFYAKAEKLKSIEKEIMEEFLQEISDQYMAENQDSFPLNKALLFDQTVSFCRDRQLEILQKTIEGHRLSGDFSKAESLISNFGKITQQVSQWINPFDLEEVNKTFDDEDEDKLFKLPGALGELIGYMQRGWLVGIMGPAKRGKSFAAWEIAYQGLSNKLKVAIFSFEMGKTTYKKRIYKRMTAMAESGGEYIYPVFDCLANQDGSCTKPERTNRESLRDREGKIIEYSPESSYRPCTACRRVSKDFFPTSWWQTQYQKENLSPGQVLKKIKTFKKLYGNNLRIRCFPAFSAGMDEAIAELDNLKAQGFEPDIILFDYFDIMAAEVMNELEDENRKWKKGKGLAGERHCLVINCHQGNRESEEKANMKQKHTGGSIKKLQHLDLDITLNQTEMEKRAGKMRFQILVNRHEEGVEKGEVVVLQSLKLGQTLIDSEWKKDKRKVEE